MYKVFNTDAVSQILTCKTGMRWRRECQPTYSSSIPSHPTRCRNKDDLQHIVFILQTSSTLRRQP